MDILNELNKYLLWDYLLLVILVNEAAKSIIGTLPSYKRLIKNQQREIKKWVCFFIGGAIALIYYRVYSKFFEVKTEFLAFQIKMLINYFASTSMYDLVLKPMLRKLWSKNSDNSNPNP